MELRECPFCGGEPELCVGHHGNTDAKVVCADCQAEGPVFGTDDWSGKDHTQEAATAWNSRADDRYRLTEAGRAMLRDAQQGEG